MKLDNLVKLADDLDSKGLKIEADKLDTILAEMGDNIVKAQAEEKEKKERQTSKKVMSIFRRLKEAAEKACDAEIDTRGPYRPLFDKARFSAQEICELLKDIEFTVADEQKAAEDGTIEQNLAAPEGGPFDAVVVSAGRVALQS